MTMSQVHLHRDDIPDALAILDVLLGPRGDHQFIGYEPDDCGATVDWDRLTSGVLSSTEVATIHIARGCAIAEAHGGGLPRDVRCAVVVALAHLTYADLPAALRQVDSSALRVMPLV